MNSRHRAGAALALLLTLAAGCGRHRSLVAPALPGSGDPPRLSIHATRIGAAGAGLSRYRVSWSVTSGSIDHFVYTFDPRAAGAVDARWTSTRATSLDLVTPARSDGMAPERGGRAPATTLLVRAVDGSGRLSPLGGISVINDNLAPTVQILQPVPSDRYRTYLAPSVQIFWTGDDPDGQFTNKPVQYKWILLTSNTAVSFQTALVDPDSVRRFYEPTGYAAWDSTNADTTRVSFQNLVVGADYMFVVVAKDEQGAFSQIFSMNSNMLNFRVTFENVGGPLLTMFNSFFNYQYVTATYLLGPQYEAFFEAPAGAPVTVHWFGQPVQGAGVLGYRWALDIADVFDETPRIDEATDVTHWSARAADLTSATVGPFGPGETHWLYIDAMDTNGLRSLGIARFATVQLGATKDLLIVDDTRLALDQKLSGATCVSLPTSGMRWPTAAELDSFLYARGGVPWRCYPAGTMSTPGLFAAYAFDTIGTRGSPLAIPSLATLAQYAHVIWLTDLIGANNTQPSEIGSQITALRSMTAPGRSGPLATYVGLGGDLWMAGGGAAYASLIGYNRVNNDVTQPAPGTTFAANNGELFPGRLPYEAGWQSEVKATLAPVTLSRSLGRFETTPSQYVNLPAAMRARTQASDPFPPGRTFSAGSFYYTNFAVEYISRPNSLSGDLPGLDSLYAATGQSVVPAAFNPSNVCMTVHRNPGEGRLVFTGFDFWSFQRTDCKGLVDFVVGQLWGIGAAAPIASDDLPGPIPPVPVRP